MWWKSVKLLCQINGGIAQERLILLRMAREDETLSQCPWWRGPDFPWETEDCWPSVKYEEVPDSDPEVQASANDHAVSLRTHHSDNYTDGCNKTSNKPEDRHGGLKKLIKSCIQSYTPCCMDSAILLVDRKWEGCSFYWTIALSGAKSVSSRQCSE